MATMKDVADRAGVSLSTVSYVLSGARSISEPTRQLILQAMADLQYQPNAVARALASKRTRVLALALAPQDRGLDLTELEFVRGATAAARAIDHHLVLLTDGMDDEAELAYLKRQGLIDGLIVMEVRLQDPRLTWLANLDLPFSLIGRPDPRLGIPYVDVDFDRSFAAAVDHLADLGHRRLALINQGAGAFEAGYGPVVRAEEAFRRRCEARGVEALVRFTEAAPRGGFEAVDALFGTGGPAPTGLVVMNDRALPGLLQALGSRGLAVPGDVSVVAAVTSASAAERHVPALTSVDVPAADLARLAVANLIRAIEAPAQGRESVVIPCRLAVRSSTGPAPRR